MKAALKVAQQVASLAQAPEAFVSQQHRTTQLPAPAVSPIGQLVRLVERLPISISPILFTPLLAVTMFP